MFVCVCLNFLFIFAQIVLKAKALMEAIRRLIRESGGAVPTPEEEQAAVTGRLESLILESGMRPAMLEEMRGDNGQWNLTHRFPLRSHRAGGALL